MKKHQNTKCKQLEAQCFDLNRQYNELNRHIKSLAVYLLDASEECTGESQQLYISQAVEEISHVRKESWNLRVKLKETVMLIKKLQDKDEQEEINEEVACT